MKNLLLYAKNIGCHVSYKYMGCSTCEPESGRITLQPGQSDEEEMMDLAHELGHLITFLEGESEKKFPHLRLFRKTRKLYRKSKKFMEAVYAEEERAWEIAEELLYDFEYIPDCFQEYKENNLKTYREAIKC